MALFLMDFIFNFDGFSVCDLLVWKELATVDVDKKITRMLVSKCS